MAKKETISEKQFESACKHLVDLGLPTFVIGAPPDEDNVIHMRFNNIKMQDALNVINSLFLNAIDIELKNHPEYSKEYASIFQGLKQDFIEIIRKSNAKVEKFNRKLPAD